MDQDGDTYTLLLQLTRVSQACIACGPNTSGAKLNMLDNIGKYGWTDDYVKEREEIVKAMTVEQAQVRSGRTVVTGLKIRCPPSYLVIPNDTKQYLPTF